MYRARGDDNWLNKRMHLPGRVLIPNSQVAFFEKVLEAAGVLRLDRLISLIEWECRQLVNTTTVSLPMFVFAWAYSESRRKIYDLLVRT